MTNKLIAACGVLLLCACEGDAPPAASQPDAEGARADSRAAPVRDGQFVYQQHCASCHENGANGAPAVDHVPSWASRSPEWTALLKQHATQGFLSMSAKGGNPELSEADVSLAVDYMVTRIIPPSVLLEGSAQGRLVYQTACSECHDAGVGGAPVIGDTAAWAARSLNWAAVLEQHANQGFLGMPPKGDQLQLFTQDVAAAIAFMVAWSRRN